MSPTLRTTNHYAVNYAAIEVRRCHVRGEMHGIHFERNVFFLQEVVHHLTQLWMYFPHHGKVFVDLGILTCRAFTWCFLCSLRGGFCHFFAPDGLGFTFIRAVAIWLPCLSPKVTSIFAASFVAHLGISTAIDFPSFATLMSSFVSEMVTSPTPERAVPVNDTQTASC